MVDIKDNGFCAVSFETNEDFELGGPHNNRRTQYQIYNKGSKKGVVVYIPGFGSDLGGYAEAFCKRIAEKYDLSVMHVDYFCMFSRPGYGADVNFELPDQLSVKKQIIDNGGIPSDEIHRNLEIINNICRLKNRKQILVASLVPKNGDYQNFGIMAALDVLNAVKDAVKRFCLDENKIILIGSSYGGYIANLVTKVAPGYISAVFDNSSWAKPNFLYLAGRELNFHTGEYEANLTDNIILRLYVKSPWTLISGLPNSMEKSRLSIRSFDYNQLQMMADRGASNSTLYFFYHSIKDSTAPVREKIDMASNMAELGFNVQMKLIEESDVDGSFVKNLSHGMGLSMTMFFDLCFKFMEEKQFNFKSIHQNLVCYSFDDAIYKFDLSHCPIKASVVAL